MPSKPMRFRGGGRLGEGPDHLVDVPRRHRGAVRTAVEAHAGRALGGDAGRQAPGLARHARVPQLRHDAAARAMDLVDDPGPAGQRVRSVEVRHIVVRRRGRAVDEGALGDDQPGPAGRPPRVVRGDVLTRHPARREAPGHRRHGDPVPEGQIPEGERPSQKLCGSRVLVRRHRHRALLRCDKSSCKSSWRHNRNTFTSVSAVRWPGGRHRHGRRGYGGAGRC